MPTAAQTGGRKRRHHQCLVCNLRNNDNDQLLVHLNWLPYPLPLAAVLFFLLPNSTTARYVAVLINSAQLLITN